jgi:hypothetical protein
MNGASRGVIRLKWPVTVTVTRLAGLAPFVHAVEHDIDTSAVVTVTNELVDSRVAAHITRFVSAHAVPADHESG